MRSTAPHTACALLLTFCGLCAAQDFPPDATTPSAAEITRFVGGKVFNVTQDNGVRWRLEYKENGYWFINTSTGFNGSGKWHSEDGKLCALLQGRDREPQCGDVRMAGGQLVLRRTNGEIVRYVQP